MFVFALPIFASGQSLKIDLELRSAAGKEVYLASHYFDNIYAKDSVRLDENGRGFFSSDSLLPQGLYKIYMDEKNHFDLLLGADQQFSLKNESFEISELQVSGSEETEAFISYMSFLRNLQDELADLREQMDEDSGDKAYELLKKTNEMTSELYSYWDRLEKDFPDSFLPKFVKAGHVPDFKVSELPPEVQKNETQLAYARYYHQVNHFWDNFDYRDERFLYTPFFKKKLETWFTKVLYQNYDSVKGPVMNFIGNVESVPRVFQFVTSYFLNNSLSSKIMGMDALFVDIAREYYLSGKAFWASEETLEKVIDNVIFMEHNLVGNIAPDLTLETYDGGYENLHQIYAKYTVILIYEPDCSHCNVFVPDLYNKVYLPYRDKGVEVFAIYSMDKKEKWGSFLAKHSLFDWINVWDKHHVSRFKVLYDGRFTPAVIILDENKKIIAKNLKVETIVTFLENSLN